jgi:hypothetical protein
MIYQKSVLKPQYSKKTSELQPYEGIAFVEGTAKPSLPQHSSPLPRRSWSQIIPASQSGEGSQRGGVKNIQNILQSSVRNIYQDYHCEPILVGRYYHV